VRQFMQPDFEQCLMDTLHKHQVTPAQLELELTETLLVSDDATLSLLLQRLWVAGFSLSLDDFGTGYSSLSYLIRFNLNTVKIDRSFVMSLESDKRHQALAQTIIAMGHSLGLKVVAEGVETAAQRDFLTQHGCDYLQGYWLGKPAPAHALSLSPRSFE
jgi:EAL domain-containing protein (putative c-di-GMP-specific phosphodiesterase class I)